MGLTVFPKNATHPDERLRILWIEDRLGFVPELSESQQETIQIVCAQRPSEALALLKEGKHKQLLGDGFDAYITDFRLTDRMSGPELVEAHIVPDRDENFAADLGRRAPAAGFLLGVLFSFHFPDRPSLIVPYSGYPDEFGATWHLVRAFAPPKTRILEPDSKIDVRLNPELMVELASTMFRDTLLAWIGSGKVTVRTRELDDLISEASHDRVPLNSCLTLIYGSNVRRIRLAALMLDKSEIDPEGIPVFLLREFASSLPKVDIKYTQALEIAEMFIREAEQPPIIDLYEKAYFQIDNQKLVQVEQLPTSRPWLGTDVHDGQATATDRRNALLIILVYLIARYITPLQLFTALEDRISEPETVTLEQARDTLLREHKLEFFPVVRRGIEALIHEASDENVQSLAALIDNFHSLSRDIKGGARRKLERLLQRYVDPAPKSTDKIQSGIRADTRIGKGLQRLLEAKDPREPDAEPVARLQTLLQGRQCLREHQLRVASDYARQVLPPTVETPAWLNPM